MEQKAINDKTIVRYLLGELSEEEQAKIEEQYFVDDEYFEQLVAIEDDLIDSYVKGELSPLERERFEKHFLNSPQRRQRLEFAKTLMKVVAETVRAEQPVRTMVYDKSRPWWQALFNFLIAPNPAFSFAVLLLGAVVGGSWLMIQTQELRTRLTAFDAEKQLFSQRQQELQDQVAQQRDRSDQLANQLENERSQRTQLEQKLNRLQSPQPAMDSFVFFADATRGAGEENRVVIKSGTDFVELKLVLENPNSKSYRATIQNADEEIIASQSILPARPTKSEKMITWRLSMAYFLEDEYLLTLEGMTDSGKFELVDSYKFSVQKN